MQRKIDLFETIKINIFTTTFTQIHICLSKGCWIDFLRLFACC